MDNLSGDDLFACARDPEPARQRINEIIGAFNGFKEFLLNELHSVLGNFQPFPNGSSTETKIMFQQIENSLQLCLNLRFKQFTGTVAEQIPEVLHVSTQTDSQQMEQLTESDFLLLSDADIDWLMEEIYKPEYGLNEQLFANLHLSPSASYLPEQTNDKRIKPEQASKSKSKIAISTESGPSNVSPKTESLYEISPTSSAQVVSLKIIMERLKCPFVGCERKVKNKLVLNAHLLKRHGIEEFRCKVRHCQASFAISTQLNKHLTSSHGKLHNWPCNECDLHYLTYTGLKKHCVNMHEKGRFRCSADGCHFVAKNRGKVRIHQNKHRRLMDSEKAPQYLCRQCSKSFSYKQNMVKHSKKHCPNRKANND